ncbi:MAG: hypothetical protein IKL68_05895 [Clostridia bacterium]|nr:hypothetical protein [Clostridia bacterium]
MKNIFKSGITGNTLKLIALITMVLDHIGYYFASELDYGVLLALRWLGRMSMPIYTYLVVQGFFYTKDFKKYVGRMFILATITQASIAVVGYIGFKITEMYYPQVCNSLNVLFTYTIALLVMKLLHERIIIKKWDYTKNLSIRVVAAIVLCAIAILVPIDYSYIGVVLTVLFYFIEKYKTKYLVWTDGFRKGIGKYIKFDDSKVVKTVYVLALMLALVALAPAEPYPIPVILAIIPLALYNGERGNKSKILKYSYYLTFPLQHILLYSLAIMFVLT